MSGSTIGGVIGGVIGFWVGGPAGAQVGWMLGSAVGGYIDPQKIAAPDLGDAQTQTTSDGVPIAVCYGHTPPFFGNVIDGEQKARRIKGKYRRAGKGGPKVQDPDKYLITYAIGVCEGPGDIVRIRRNGQLVYDVTPGSQIPGDTAAFRSKLRIYRGTEDQLPDPALEAIHGVGNTPYFRGLLYVVVVDDDVTDTAGTIPKLSFEVVKGGTTSEVTITDLKAKTYSQFQNGDWPLVNSEVFYTYTGTRTTSGETRTASALTIQGVIDQFSEMYPTGELPRHYLGYSANASPAGSGQGISTAMEQPDVTENVNVFLYYNDFVPVETLPIFNGGPGQCFDTPPDSEYRAIADGFLTIGSSSPIPGYEGLAACGDYSIYGLAPLIITVGRKNAGINYVFGDPCELQTTVKLPDAPSMLVDCDGNITSGDDFDDAPVGAYLVLQTEETGDNVDDNEVYTRYLLGPVLAVGDPDDGPVFWTAAYNAAVLAGTMPPGLVYGVDYPSLTDENDIYASSSSTVTIEDGEIALREVQQDLAARCNVPADKIDCTELTDIIPGYLVAVPATGADCSRPLQQVFFYDFPEFDAKLRAIKRGADTIGDLVNDDLIDVEDGDDDTRPQQVEYPRKLHLAYPDPESNYTVTKQTAERVSPDIHAVGEQMVAVPIPFDKDTAAQKVAIMHKIAYADAEGRIVRILPEEYTTWVSSDCFNYEGKRWRIEKTDIQDGTNRIEAVYDRASNYQSTATGAEARPPLPPTSALIGPTRFEFINASPLVDSNDKIGFYIGVCGILEGWYAYTPRVSVDGGETYVQYPQITQPAVMGYTTNVLPSGSPYVYDPDATVTVKVHGGEPESATFEQLLNEANAAIIGEEIIQFATVTEVGVNTFQLTGLTRARQNTQVTEHGIHTRFVVLDGVNFLEAPSSWIGQTLLFDVTSDGTSNGYLEEHIWSPALIQTEWEPVAFTEDYDGMQTVIGWVGRGRLGTSLLPFNSAYFDGYRITFTDGVITKSYNTTEQSYTYTDAQRTADFGDLDPLDVSIIALNKIPGGNSSALTGTI